MSVAKGGLRHEGDEDKFVVVPRLTIRDSSLSFKARGLLAFILDQPEGWDVRATWLVTQGTEGREAIYSALKELRAAGYYRVERRQVGGGRWVTGTAVSKRPRRSWAAEYAEQEAAREARREVIEPVVVVLEDGTVVDGEGAGDGVTDVREPVDRSPGDRSTADRSPVVPTEEQERRSETEGVTAAGERHQRATTGEQPPLMPDGVNRTCPAHRLTPAVGPCPPCGDWRRAVEAQVAQDALDAAHRAQVARDEARAASELRAAEVTACQLCDAGGRLPSGLACLHDPAKNARPDAGGFAEFQRLRAEGIPRSEDGRDPAKGRRRARAERQA